MKNSSSVLIGAVALGLAMFAPLKASAQGVTIYIGPGYPGQAAYPPYGGGYPVEGGYPVQGGYPVEGGYPVYDEYPSYSYSYPSYGYGYGYRRPYVGTYWGQSRRVARRVNRRWDRWD
jgi:hypothetical protein